MMRRRIKKSLKKIKMEKGNPQNLQQKKMMMKMMRIMMKKNQAKMKKEQLFCL
jgi:hypothetical protein